MAEHALNFGRISRKLIDSMPLGLVVFDENLTIKDRNPAAEELLAAGDNLADVLRAGSPHQRPEGWGVFLRSALTVGESQGFGNIAYALDGRDSVLDLTISALGDEESGELIGGILIIEDETVKVSMADELAGAERLAAVGKLAARVAHELNNPLDGILRYIGLAQRVAENNNEERAVHYLQESRKGLLRMVQIVSELLDFSRSTHTAFEEADINKLVEDAIKAMSVGAERAGVRIQREFGEKMPNVRTGNLFQVFCNLIKNAVDAMEEQGRGGVLTVRTYYDERNALIEFADTGPGLSEEVMEKIFEAFFTTKAKGKGTGLGLAICLDIMERCGGKIKAQNHDEGGALFTVSIPLERTSWARV